MQKEEAIKVFEKEFASYESKSGLEDWTGEVLATLPDYFWTCPASSTGKHHSAIQNGERGNVIHTKMNVQIANTLFGLDRWAGLFPDPLMRDMIRTALILHDGLKYGDGSSGLVVHEHPVLMANYLITQWVGTLPNSILQAIAGMIAAHSGKWTTSKHSTVVLPYPKNEAEYFVHICDYLGSRGNIMVAVDETASIFGITPMDVPQIEPSQKNEMKVSVTEGNPLLDDEINFVKMLVRGNHWNGKVYGKTGSRFLYLNGIQVHIDEKFLPAIQIVALTGV